MPVLKWPENKMDLFELGIGRVHAFCRLNDIDPPVRIDNNKPGGWIFDACAYYRPWAGIQICVTDCQTPCSPSQTRNWSWPASVIDREPYGVLCHELGHHCDWTASEHKGSYGGDYSGAVRERSGEDKITNYCPDDGEWFAEMFRVFVTNPMLLQQLRPCTFKVLCERWKPLGEMHWRVPLGVNVPERVVKSLVNKGCREK